MKSSSFRRFIPALIAMMMLLSLFPMPAMTVNASDYPGITDNAGVVSLNLDFLRELGVEAWFDAADTDAFTRPEVSQKLSVTGDGVFSLTVEQLRFAVSANQPGYDVLIGTDNLTESSWVDPGRVTLPDSALIADGANQHGNTTVNYSIVNPRMDNAVYLFVVPAGGEAWSATTVFYVEYAFSIAPLSIINDQPITEYIKIDDDYLAGLGVNVRFETKRQNTFASTYIVGQITLEDNDTGPGIASLTVGQFASALSSVDSNYSFVLCSGNIYALYLSQPTRAEFSDPANQLLRSGTNMHGTLESNYTISYPTTSNAVYAIRVANNGGTITAADNIIFYIQEYIPPIALEDALDLGVPNGKWGDMSPGTYFNALDSVLIRGAHDSVEVYSMYDENYYNIPLDEITSGTTGLTRVTSMNDFGPGTFILQSVTSIFGNYNYIFVFPADVSLDELPAPELTDGMIIPILAPASGNVRTAMNGQDYWVTDTGIPRTITVPMAAGALNTLDIASGYITYPAGVYRVAVENGTITDFWHDYDVMDLGYTIERTGSNTLELGIHPTAYTYDSSTLFFDFSSFSYVTQDAFENTFTADTRMAGYQYWAIDADGNGVLEYLYYMTNANVTSDNLSLYEQFNAVIPEGVKYSIDGENSDKAELKYVYYEPETTEPSAVVFWLPGSGAGYDAWQNLFLSPSLLNWTQPDIQSQFEGGAYIVVPSAQVHPVIGQEYRWDNLYGTIQATDQLIALIKDFIATHNIDETRVYIGGVSVGGGMTMWAIQDSPEIFAAAFPVSPTLRSLYPRDTTKPNQLYFDLNDTSVAEALNAADLPIWLLVGEGDDLAIPLATSLTGHSTVSTVNDVNFANALLTGSADSRVTVFETAIFNGETAHGFPASSVLRNLTNATTMSPDVTAAGDGPVTAVPPATGNTWLSGNSAPLTANSTLIEWLAAQARQRPDAVIDYPAEELTGLEPDTEYTVGGELKLADASGKIVIDESWMTGNTVSIIRLATTDKPYDSISQELIIPARPAAPDSVSKTDTYFGFKNGILSGVDDTMEYKLSIAGVWTGISGTSVEELAAGTYSVRYKATSTAFASTPVSGIVIADSETPVPPPPTNDSPPADNTPPTNDTPPADNTPPTDPSANDGTAPLGSGEISTPAGQDPVKNDNSTTTLPGGGKITKPEGTEVTVPSGTVIGNDGSVILPSDNGGTISMPGDSGNGGATIDLPPGTIIGENGTVNFPQGSGGGTVTYENGFSFNIPEDTILILDEQAPLGFYMNPNKQFNDANAGDWFYDAAMYACGHGLMNGTGADEFSPNTPTSRGMIVTILYRMAGSPDVSGMANPFNDVDADKWYSDAVIWAASNGIVSGYGDGLFGSDDSITREQLATIISNYIKFAGLTLPELREYTGFSDSAAFADYSRAAIEQLYKAMVINGKPGNTFDPTGAATRAEVATILVNLLMI